MSVVVAGLLAAPEDSVQLPLISEIGGDRAAAGLYAPRSICVYTVRASAIEQPEALGGQLGGVAGVVELAGGEVVKAGNGFALEALQLDSAATPRELLYAGEDARPVLFIVRVGLMGGAVSFVGAVLFEIAQRLVHERVVQAAVERDDVLDVELGVIAEEAFDAYVLSGVGALPAAFVGKEPLLDVGATRIREAGFGDDLTGGFFPALAILRVSQGYVLAVFTVALEIAGEFDSDVGGKTVLAHDGVDHFAEFG